jgi:hypothetical protein
MNAASKEPSLDLTVGAIEWWRFAPRQSLKLWHPSGVQFQQYPALVVSADFDHRLTFFATLRVALRTQYREGTKKWSKSRAVIPGCVKSIEQQRKCRVSLGPMLRS